MTEIDSDLDNFSVDKSILMNYNNTPTPSVEQNTGSILRHCIFQGVTTQIVSAAVNRDYFQFVNKIDEIYILFVGSNISGICNIHRCIEDDISWNFSRIYSYI